MSLNKLLAELDRSIPKWQEKNSRISSADIGWHIEHSLLTLNAIMDQLRNANPSNYRYRFSISKLLVMGSGRIPRGVARSPRGVRPLEYSESGLRQHLNATKNSLLELESLSPALYFEHPYFGHLRLKPAIRFMRIHTLHHVKIIRDIQRKAASS